MIGTKEKGEFVDNIRIRQNFPGNFVSGTSKICLCGIDPFSLALPLSVIALLNSAETIRRCCLYLSEAHF